MVMGFDAGVELTASGSQGSPGERPPLRTLAGTA
jgi:hypothetical protein